MLAEFHVRGGTAPDDVNAPYAGGGDDPRDVRIEIRTVKLRFRLSEHARHVECDVAVADDDGGLDR